MSPQETGAFIARLRKEYGLTQQELAEKINITAKAVSRWETGKGYPDITILPELSKILGVSVNELLNGERYSQEDIATIAEKTVLTVISQAATDKRRNSRRLIIIGTIAIVIVCMLCTSIIYGVSRSLKGKSYAILSSDLSYLIYYGERYVPFDIKEYSCRLEEEIVDEIRLDNGMLFDKLFSEYALQAVSGVSDNSLIYLRSEHDIDFYVKESMIEYYQKQLSDFTPYRAYAVYEQTNGYEKELLLENDLFEHICSLSPEDREPSLTCEFSPKQKRMTVIVYSTDNIFYKEYGDIFIVDNNFYWYNYEEIDYPDSVAYKQIPYKISKQYDKTLKALFIHF